MNRRDFLKNTLLGAGVAMVGMGGTGRTLSAVSAQDKPQAAPVPKILLGNGTRIPQLGFGTWTLAENTTKSVRAAAEAGYRLFDTAQGYGNEKEVWAGIRQSGLSRKEVFITTKIAPDSMRKPPQSRSIDESIEKLGGEYIDLMLIHWPVKERIRETWETMESYVDKGLIKNLGLSNFNPHHIEDLLKYARIKPVLNQIEIHPYMTQEANVKATRSFGIEAECWSPLSQGKVMQDAVIKNLAQKYGKSPAQVTLRWEIQRGLIVIPRSKNPAHIKENIDVFDFVLSEADMNAISALNRNERCNPKNDPDNFPW